MKRLSKRFKRTLKRSQTGQAIILLAIGFITLIGFVGLVVDLSVLYIRYAALRRAVDSAAVAAAGQFSRTVDDVTNKQRTTFAARQFLEFHGIDPDSVVVDSCSSVPNETTVDRNGDGQITNWNYTDTEIEAAPEDDPPENFDADPSNDVLTQADLTYRRDLFSDVCDPDRVGVADSPLSGRKLVRVQASIVVPTSFMGFFGQDEFELTASAVSETASLDVVIIMDVSESMLFDTTYDDYDRWLFNAGEANDAGARVIRYLPSRISNGVYSQYVAKGGTDSFDQFQLKFLANYPIDNMSNVVDPGLVSYDRAGGGVYDGPVPFQYPGPCGTEDPCVLNVGYGRYYVTGAGDTRLLSRGTANISVGGYGTLGATTGTTQPLDTAPGDYFDLRPQCRVAVHPASWLTEITDVAPNNMDGTGYGTEKSLRQQFIDITGGASSRWSTTNGQMQMFQPNFDFYGCCNDPSIGSGIEPRTGVVLPFGYDEDGNRTGASDAERQAAFSASTGTFGGDFDFSDLVCQPFKQARDASQEFLYNIDFVAGDRVAFVTFDRAAYAIDPDGPDDADGDGVDHTVMIEDRNIAERVLVQSIGVRAEPNFYHRETTSPEAPTTPGGISTDFSNGVFKWRGFTESTDDTVDVDGDGITDLTSTPLDITAYGDTQAGLWTQQYLTSGSCAFYNAMLPGDEGPNLNPFGGSLWDDNGQDWGILWDPTFVAPFPFNGDAEIRSSVESIAAENFYGYHTYSLWGNCRGTNIGAALREANDVLVDDRWTRRDGAVWVVVLLSDGAAGATDPINDSVFNPYQREGADYTTPSNPQRGDYGAFGFCPPKTMNTTGEPTTSTEVVSGYALDDVAPHCVDLNPETRHACATDLDGNVSTKSTGVEIDLIASQTDNIDWSNPGCRTYDPDDYARDWADFVAMERPNEIRQLPTIYTIGFNLEYNAPAADIDGDGTATLCEGNPTDCLGEELLRYIADIGDNNRRDIGDYPSSTEDRFVRINYGNYWNAPDGDELRDVFDEIASRLFVRLTG